MTISLCMIVRNEAESLARCLESAKGVADEIILVDTGSTDGTIDIAKRYTQKVYEFAWVDDFAAARNFAFSKATRQYWTRMTFWSPVIGRRCCGSRLCCQRKWMLS